MAWKIEDTFGRLDLRNPWAWRIFHWSKGAVSPDTVVNQWTVTMVLECLDMIEAYAEIDQIYRDSAKPPKRKVKRP